MSGPQPSSRVHTVSLVSIFVLSIGFRLLLATVNRSANDDHMEVIQRIVAGERPLAADCWQCYQPKLYHDVVADVIGALGLTGQIPQVLAAQLTSCVAGIATLVLLWAVAKRLPASPVVRLTSFGLVALNPRFCGITAQATNDAFVILFGTAAIYAFLRYVASGKATDLALTTLALVLASVSKFQGVVLFAMISTLLLVRAALSPAGVRRRALGAVGLLVAAYVATTPFVGDYAESWRRTGDPFAANWERGPAPDWFEHSYYRSPGVRSIVDGFLTFRIVDLVRQPYVQTGRGVLRPGTPRERYDPRFAEHRTSLWSQLYGRAQFVRFGSNPPRWGTRDPRVLNLGRALLIAGLVPLAALVLGAVLEARDLARGLASRGLGWLAEDERWMLLALFCGSFLVVAQLSYLMRDYSSMKVIYVFPGLAAILAIHMRGLSAWLARWAQRPLASRALVAAHGVVLLLYVADLTLLLAKLALPR